MPSFIVKHPEEKRGKSSALSTIRYCSTISDIFCDLQSAKYSQWPAGRAVIILNDQSGPGRLIAVLNFDSWETKINPKSIFRKYLRFSPKGCSAKESES